MKFKTTVLKSRLYNYSDSGAIQADRNNKQVIFKKCARFTDCVTEIDYTKTYNAKDHDVVLPVYDLIEYKPI